jgi:hypothetical protein
MRRTQVQVMVAACTAERRSTSWSDRAPSISSFVTRCVEKMACEAKTSQGSKRQTTTFSLIKGENYSIAYPQDVIVAKSVVIGLCPSGAMTSILSIQVEWHGFHVCHAVNHT